MKFTSIITLLIAFSVRGQQVAKQPDSLVISGQVVLMDTDTLSKNRIGLIANAKHPGIRPFDISDNGHFEIAKLSSGRYVLSFKVNEDYNKLDTVVSLSNYSMLGLRITLSKKPCRYDAVKDINENHVKILINGSIGPRLNSKADYSFEKRFRISYVIFGDAMTESFNCHRKYNDIVFQFLDNKYGRKWRKNVRHDSVGLK